jgi:hypothetical protein
MLGTVARVRAQTPRHQTTPTSSSNDTGVESGVRYSCIIAVESRPVGQTRGLVGDNTEGQWNFKFGLV